jgi:hypothetical protein
MPKATIIGKADEGNLQVRLDEGSGDRKTSRVQRDRPEFQRPRILGACKRCLLHSYSTKRKLGT